MKICIIGFPRSRSSILLETISLFYNIPILGEDVNQLTDRRVDYKFRLLPLLANIKGKSAGVIRLHPLQLAEVPFQLVNFSNFQFKQYNKIYFTLRESITDNIASNFVATKLNKFTYKSQDDIVKNIEPFYFAEDDHYHVRDYIQSLKIIDLLKQYFNENSIPSQDLYYNDIPQYLTKYQTSTTHIETHYDYRNMISNYDEIIEIYNQKIANEQR